MTTEPLASEYDGIRVAFEEGDYETVISRVRDAMTTDPIAAIADPVINQWLGLRFRNIFIEEASNNPDAVKSSRAPFPFRLIDSKVGKARVAARMIKDFDPAELELDLPLAQMGTTDNTTILFVPGLLTGMLGIAFEKVFPVIVERFGVKILAADVHPFRGCDANVADIENAVEKGIGRKPELKAPLITAEDNPTPPKEVILIGYSKGGPDILTFLAARPDLAPKVKAVMGWAGANGGSWLADGMYEQAKAIPNFEVLEKTATGLSVILKTVYPFISLGGFQDRPDEVDILGAMKDLTTTQREAFLAEHAQAISDLGIPQFTFSGATTSLDVPAFQLQGYRDLAKHDPDNDMQLTQAEAAMPAENAPHLAMFHANHWDLSYDSFPWADSLRDVRTSLPFAREPAMAAIVLFMSEIGLLT
ncbi:MAG: hypothetical protein WCI74_14055 [Actinomycetes bacterium]